MKKNNKILCIILICVLLSIICICVKTCIVRDEKSLDVYIESLNQLEDISPTEETEYLAPENHNVQYNDLLVSNITVDEEQLYNTNINVDWFTYSEYDYEWYGNVLQYIVYSINTYFDGQVPSSYTCSIEDDIHDSVTNMIFEVYVHGDPELNIKLNMYDNDIIVEAVYVPPYGYDEDGNVVVPNLTVVETEYDIPDYVSEFFSTGDVYTCAKQEIKYIEDILGVELVVSGVEIYLVSDDYYSATYSFENIPLGVCATCTWETAEAEFEIYDIGNTVESGGAYIYFPDGIPDNLAYLYYSPSYPASMMYGVCLGHDGDTYYLRDMETNIDYTVTIGM